MLNCYFQYGVVAFVAIFTVISQSDGRELRPSDHGLSYQDSSPPMKANGTAEMLYFFGATTSSSSAPLPKTKNFSDPATWWSNHKVGRSSGEHLKRSLLVASLICGLTGVALLSVAGIIFLLRLRKENKKKSASSSAPTSAPNALAHK
ncbi:uncharacterized protein LOC111370282 [Olea europaea var. sylvestris]|uniref:uncharacterized protein LOC111370282 n=1 Tax=Olea europaea var. sylvestris TaxID=158386 RepID=UPI000C1D06EC|nr:uncharacterized protein LOC111370282 [Olea europaea var. sylvestris]